MKQETLGLIASILMRLLRLTYRYNLHFKNEEHKALYLKLLNAKKPDPKQNFLIGFFHQDELSLIPYYKNSNISVLISKSKDGEIMSQASIRLGYLPIRGSSSRSAIAGLLGCIKSVRKGNNLAMAVDGPRGPIHKVKDGLCAVSKKTDRPIIPVRAFVHNAKIFKNSWSQARFPKPFTKIDFFIGDIRVYETIELEQELLSLN